VVTGRFVKPVFESVRAAFHQGWHGVLEDGFRLRYRNVLRFRLPTLSYVTVGCLDSEQLLFLNFCGTRHVALPWKPFPLRTLYRTNLRSRRLFV
jgi:hypothetical protein